MSTTMLIISLLPRILLWRLLLCSDILGDNIYQLKVHLKTCGWPHWKISSYILSFPIPHFLPFSQLLEILHAIVLKQHGFWLKHIPKQYLEEITRFIKCKLEIFISTLQGCYKVTYTCNKHAIRWLCNLLLSFQLGFLLFIIPLTLWPRDKIVPLRPFLIVIIEKLYKLVNGTHEGEGMC